MGELVLRELTRIYPSGTRAVDSLTLEVADGELVVVVGPSGCGKTTLLRLIAGLEPVTSGDIAIAGRVVNRVEPARRDVAMVFQSLALYPHMTVFANMAYALRARGVRRAEIARRVGNAAAMLDLGEVLGRRPHELSGGERQRVAIGRAIVRAPEVFLFDEPLSSLDATLRGRMRLEIRTLQRELATTTIHVTHDQAEAMTLADRLVVMNEGRAEQVGAPAEVYHRPASAFVAGLIGAPAMNLLAAEVGAMTGALHLARDASITGDFGHLAAEAGTRVTLGIRPEHISIADAGAPSQLQGEVVAVERLGAETVAHARIAGGVYLTLRLAGDPVLGPGDVVPLAIGLEKLHFFSAETGARIDVT